MPINKRIGVAKELFKALQRIVIRNNSNSSCELPEFRVVAKELYLSIFVNQPRPN